MSTSTKRRQVHSICRSQKRLPRKQEACAIYWRMSRSYLVRKVGQGFQKEGATWTKAWRHDGLWALSNAGRWGQLDKSLAGHVEGEELELEWQTATLSKKEFSFILKAVANSLNPDGFKQWIILAFWKMTVDYLEDPWDKIQPEARIRKVMGTVDEEIVSVQFSSIT